MPRILSRRRPLTPLPRLERGVEPLRTETDLMVQVYALVAPLLRRSLPPTNAKKLQGSKRQELSQCASGGA
jgi:hypothetical protein